MGTEILLQRNLFKNTWLESVFILQGLAFKSDVYKTPCTSQYGDKWQSIIHWVLPVPGPALGKCQMAHMRVVAWTVIPEAESLWPVSESPLGRGRRLLSHPLPPPVLLASTLSAFLMLCQCSLVGSSRCDVDLPHDKRGICWNDTGQHTKAKGKLNQQAQGRLVAGQLGRSRCKKWWKVLGAPTVRMNKLLGFFFSNSGSNSWVRALGWLCLDHGPKRSLGNERREIPSG